MENPKISIIVPVYNAERRLHRCIDSILAQTFRDFELLLIDDGSKDGTWEIMQEYAFKDSRIEVYHQDNYNYIDYTKDPIEFKSDMQFAYDMILDHNSINKALENKNYQNILQNINKLAYPMFQVTGVKTKIINNKLINPIISI